MNAHDVSCMVSEEIGPDLSQKVTVCFLWDGSDTEPGHSAVLSIKEVMDMVASLESGEADSVTVEADYERCPAELRMSGEEFLALLEEGDVFKYVEAVGTEPQIEVKKEEGPHGTTLSTIKIPWSGGE
ncbi:MAG: hypothetical protein WC322_06335 [Candidatus Paceibacterota bacterium]|jgi:hypothetical protein